MPGSPIPPPPPLNNRDRAAAAMVVAETNIGAPNPFDSEIRRNPRLIALPQDDGGTVLMDPIYGRVVGQADASGNRMARV